MTRGSACVYDSVVEVVPTWPFRSPERLCSHEIPSESTQASTRARRPAPSYERSSSWKSIPQTVLCVSTCSLRKDQQQGVTKG